MDHTKRNVHSAGALGMLLRTKQIKRIDEELGSQETVVAEKKAGGLVKPSLYKTSSGVVFNENELLEVDPRECEPWEYANRLEGELGNIDELAESIRVNKQLQPGLIRIHTKPHDGIKYEIIFGRRRYEACLKLGIPFLVIKKDIKNVHDAILLQDAENKLRKDVSNYSNALLYKKLIQDGVYESESDAARKMGISISTFNDIMTFSKLPQDIASKIPNIHVLSISLAKKIIYFINESNKYHSILLNHAKNIGITITSPNQLEKILKDNGTSANLLNEIRLIKTLEGKKLFKIKVSHKGITQIILDRTFEKNIDKEDFYNYLAKYVEEKIGLSKTLS